MNRYYGLIALINIYRLIAIVDCIGWEEFMRRFSCHVADRGNAFQSSRKRGDGWCRHQRAGKMNYYALMILKYGPVL